MKPAWAFQAIDEAKAAGSTVWAKQWGHVLNNPLVTAHMANHPKTNQTAAYRAVCESGAELAPEEKGGAPFRGRLWHELPPAYYDIERELNEESKAA